MANLFQKSVEKKYLNEISKDLLKEKFAKFQNHFAKPEIQQNIRGLKEEEYQEGFVRDLFVEVLGYTLNPQPNFNFVLEKKNVNDSKKADGAIHFNEKVIAVIELKGTDTTDLKSVEAQAFGYKNNQPDCKYIITSNFEKLRFYINNAVDHEEFNLFNLTIDRFALLWLCLAKENILADLPLKIKSASVLKEENITKELYNDYSSFKHDLFRNIVEVNPSFDKLILFKKSQKLLDRFLFIFFAEDKSLLPPNSISEIVKQWQELKDLDEETPLYNRFKKYFGYLNTGHKGKKHDIFAYNGGLFTPDEILDNITIDDELLRKHTLQLSTYDFETEVDVNILGHIFEHSLNELDEIQSELEGKTIEKNKTKRKKDGVFYTPKYITKYIVENTVGKLCEEKKIELEISDTVYENAKKRSRKRIENIDKYRKWLLSLTICDPACGSGAFLNMALDFLISEHRYLDELTATYHNVPIVFTDVENHILEKNIFGVDLNEESVEIARLSLWLRTAQPGRKLTTLSNNIKCGNSIINDSNIAGEKAFNWHQEFSEVFANGGFNIIIGNPPYVSLESIPENEKEFYRKNFESLERKYDTSVIFKLNALKLLKENGILGFITTVTWQTGENYIKVREYLFNTYDLLEIINLPFNVFAEAYVDTGIVIFQNKKNKKSYRIYSFNKNEAITTLENIPFEYVHDVTIDKSTWKIVLNNKTQEVYSKLKSDKNVVKLGDISISTQGLSPSRFVITDNKINETQFPYLVEGQVYQYLFIEEKVGYTNMNDKASLIQFYSEVPKILFRRLINRQDRLTISYNEKKIVFKKDINPFIINNSDFNPKYILSILASKFISYLYVNTSSIATKDDFRQTTLSEIRNLPIYKIDKLKQQPFIYKAELMLSLNKELFEISQKFTRSIQRKFELTGITKRLQDWYLFSYSDFIKELNKMNIKLSLSDEAEWETYFLQESKKALELRSKIVTTDKEIDQMVYQLYGLTEEEIKIVERKPT